MVEPGSLLDGRYLLDQRIAGGGMGEVWRARDTVLDRTVAIKTLLAELSDDPDFTARFRAEARAMAAINHAGIVEVYDFGRADRTAYLVMRYVSGEPLRAVLDRLGALDPSDVMILVAQTAEALHVAHGAGIVHRDVKPANLMIHDDGRVVLTDFGIARVRAGDGLTEEGMVLGTASYLAPEQVVEDPVTAAADVYALGVVAYECLTGRRPFEGGTPFTVALKRLSEEAPDLPAEFPESVRRVVRRALARAPEERWPSAAAMAEAAREAIADLDGPIAGAALNLGPPADDEETTASLAAAPRGAIPVRTIAPPAPAPPRGGRTRTRLAVAAAAVALLLTGGIVIAALRDGPSDQTGGVPEPAPADPRTTTAVPARTTQPGSRPGGDPRSTGGPGTPSQRPDPQNPAPTLSGLDPTGLPQPPQPPGPPPPPPEPPATVEVPNVLGMGEEEAVTLLGKYDLVAQVKYSKGRGKCGVQAQHPPAGTVVNKGSDVNLVVAKPKGSCENA